MSPVRWPPDGPFYGNRSFRARGINGLQEETAILQTRFELRLRTGITLHLLHVGARRVTKASHACLGPGWG